MKNEMVDILAMLLLLGLTIFVIGFISWYSVPDEEVLQRWADTNPEAFDKWADEHNWYYESF